MLPVTTPLSITLVVVLKRTWLVKGTFFHRCMCLQLHYIFVSFDFMFIKYQLKRGHLMARFLSNIIEVDINRKWSTILYIHVSLINSQTRVSFLYENINNVGKPSNLGTPEVRSYNHMGIGNIWVDLHNSINPKKSCMRFKNHTSQIMVLLKTRNYILWKDLDIL